MLDSSKFREIDEMVAEAATILCVSHVGPDGDAVGSLLGMYWILRALGKSADTALQDQIPESLAALPGALAVLPPARVADHYDLIICLDASSPDRMGRVYRHDSHGDIPVLVIDHHVTNTYFGTANWVEPNCAATCQMLVYLAQAWSVPLTGEIAECLLTGIVTDTLCFRTSGTDANVMAVATLLMEGGANLADITAQTLNRRKYSSMRLLAMVLPDVQFQNHVIWATISQEQLELSNHRVEDDLQLNSMLISTEGADMSAVFTEKQADDGSPAVECSFRAKPGFDVSALAYKLGGGGHPPASGCTIPGSPADVAAQVVPMLIKARSTQVAEMTALEL